MISALVNLLKVQAYGIIDFEIGPKIMYMQEKLAVRTLLVYLLQEQVKILLKKPPPPSKKNNNV